MRTARIALLWSVGLLGLLLAAEGLLRMLPVPTATRTDYYVDPAILSYPPGHRWTAATGWDLRNAQTLQANNLGFPSRHDFVPDPRAVALIGDSYVEASMLAAGDRPGAQLERAIGAARPVYSLGGPGSSLLDYAERLRFVRERLAVRDVVVLIEAGDVRQALCGSNNVHSACLHRKTLAPQVERRPPATALARFASQSALAQYFVGQLRVNAGSLAAATWRRSIPGESPKPVVTTQAAVTAEPFAAVVVDTFIERVRKLGGRIVFVVDGQRNADRPLSPALAAERQVLITRLRAAGLAVVDAEPLYAAHALRSPQRLEVGPYDAHLNVLGVGLIMRAAASALRELDVTS